MRADSAMRVLAGAALFVCLGAPTAAQEQTGSIEGIVRDQGGGLLPGVTLQATNLAVGSTTTVVSDATGAFRFPALRPGHYDVTAALDGFQSARYQRVEVLLGQIKRLDFLLGIAGISETVNVSAGSPLVDVKQSARSVSLRQDVLEHLPRGMDYTSVAAILPGANNEPRLGGLSIDGSSAAENRFIIDGIDTTSAMTGVPGQYLRIDNVEEVQVKSSGYAAEHGGSTGGVVNVLTKSGTNDWHGDLKAYFSGDWLDAPPRPTLRRNALVSTQVEYFTYVEDPYRAIEPGFSVAGPIRKNHAWFYAAYQPLLRSTDRTVTFALDRSTTTRRQDLTRHLLTTTGTWQPGPRLRTRASFNSASTVTDALLPTQDGSDSPVSNFDVIAHEPDSTASLTADLLASRRFIVSGRVGYMYSDKHTDNVRGDPRYVFALSNIGLLDVPESLQRVTGFSTDTNNYDYVKDRVGRLSTQVDATMYVVRWGEHALKAGVQADWTTNDVDKGMKANGVTLAWNRALLGRRGKYGYYGIVTNSAAPRRGQIFLGKAAGRTAGVFAQDAWTIRRRLTLNLGLRTEQEVVPRYVTDERGRTPLFEFGFADKLAPRVGGAYDLSGSGRWKAYASWGIFYDIFKYSMSTAFGGLNTISYIYTLDTYDWPNLLSNPACPPACPGTLIVGPRSGFNTPTDAIDPGLGAMRLQEAVAGLEHQARPGLLLGARYVHKQIDRTVEDIGSLDAAYNELYTVGNPGFGRATFVYPGVRMPKAVRDYDAFEVSIRRPVAGPWGFGATYSWSRLFGNYSGLSQSDEYGRISPNVGRVYDYPLTMFDEKGRPVYGNLPTDRPHQIKAHVVLATRFGLSTGAYQFASSGVPVTREVAVVPPSYYPMQYRGRMSDGRTPALTQTDLFIEQRLRAGGARRLVLALSVANLFDQKVVISRHPRENEPGSGLAVSEADVYSGRLDFRQLFIDQGVRTNTGFLMADAFQAPRTARIMVRWTF